MSQQPFGPFSRDLSDLPWPPNVPTAIWQPPNVLTAKWANSRLALTAIWHPPNVPTAKRVNRHMLAAKGPTAESAAAIQVLRLEKICQGTSHYTKARAEAHNFSLNIHLFETDIISKALG